ncbi:MAG: hypothetical protein HQM09_05175 [Candidatus Riflebacteria bacterium]|nr:hypothetical protein [Candidatus Riflebacteria bacterium]
MFGILKGRVCTLGREGRESFTAHICTTCISLGTEYGHLSRFSCNNDAALLAALAHSCDPNPQRAFTFKRCPLPPFRLVPVYDETSMGTRYAGFVSLLMARVRLADGLDDGDGIWKYLRRFGHSLVGKLDRRLASGPQRFGLDLDSIAVSCEKQRNLEKPGSGATLEAFLKPTAEAMGTVFARLGALSGNYEYTAGFRRLGEEFGRATLLLDAATDLAADRFRGAFNPLHREFTSDKCLEGAKGRFQQTMIEMRAAFDALALPSAELPEKLLFGDLSRTASEIFGPSVCAASRRRKTNKPGRSAQSGGSSEGDSSSCCSNCCLPDCGSCGDCCCQRGGSGCCHTGGNAASGAAQTGCCDCHALEGCQMCHCHAIEGCQMCHCADGCHACHCADCCQGADCCHACSCCDACHCCGACSC